jgi:hypothetical protein
MVVKGYLENERFDVFDKKGKFVKGGFKTNKEMEIWCKDNDVKLIDVLEIILTETI